MVGFLNCMNLDLLDYRIGMMVSNQAHHLIVKIVVQTRTLFGGWGGKHKNLGLKQNHPLLL